MSSRIFRKKTSRDLQISLFLSQHSVFPLPAASACSFYLSLRPVFFICHSGLFFLFVTPASFFYCHSGLRAGVQVNIDSLITWIPGQARNDKYIKVIPRFRKKTSRDLRISPFLSQHGVPPPVTLTCFFICHSGLFFYLSLRPVFLSVTPASEPESRSTLIP